MDSSSSSRTGKRPGRVSTIPEDRDEGRRRAEPPTAETLYKVAWVLYLLLALVAVVWIALREGSIELDLFVAPTPWSRLATDLGLGLALGAAVVGLWHAALRTSSVARRLERVLAQHVGDLPADRLFAVALLSGFAEELFFRGALQGSVGLFVASLLFGLCHLGPVREARWWALFATVVGFAFGAVVWWRETLLAAIVAHVLINAVGLRRLHALRAEAADGA